MASSLSPAERTLRAKHASHIRWANTDPAEASAAARRRMFDRFEAQVPDEITDPAERARRAEHLLKAHMALLALKSSRARRSGATRGTPEQVNDVVASPERAA